MKKIIFNELLGNYNKNLITKVRGFGDDSDYLQYWVPATSKINSLINLIEALFESKTYLFTIELEKKEKLDEVMCPADDSHHTIEFDDHFVIAPSVIFYSKDFDFTKNQLGESGEYVEHGFEYQSGTNDHFNPVGNPAPPLPLRSDNLISSIIQSDPLSIIFFVPFQHPLLLASFHLKELYPFKFVNI